MTKFNFGTTLKQAYLAAVREKMAAYHEPMNPHLFLGMGGPEDIMVAGREAVKARVKELIQAVWLCREANQMCLSSGVNWGRRRQVL